MSMLPLDPAALKPLLDSAIAAISAYMTYKVGMRQAEASGGPAPAASAEATQGETALATVTEAVTTHGSEDERADLASFQRNPERYAPQLAQVVQDLVARDPDLATRLAQIVQPGSSLMLGQANAQTVNGQNIGTNTGTINSTYNIGGPPAAGGDA